MMIGIYIYSTLYIYTNKYIYILASRTMYEDVLGLEVGYNEDIIRIQSP